SICRGVFCGFLKTHIKAHRAAYATFRLMLHAFGQFKPMVDMVIRIDEGNVVLFRKTDVFFLTNIVFLAWMNVRIVKIYRKIYIGSYQCFHHLARTRGTTRMQK